VAEYLGTDPADTLARFRRVLTSTTKPLVPPQAMLGEVIVHAEDVRRPLGIERDYPISTLTKLAEYYQRPLVTGPTLPSPWPWPAAPPPATNSRATAWPPLRERGTGAAR